MARRVSREGDLGDGMVITAAVRARLLGLNLLRIDADVTVSPTSARLIRHGRRAAVAAVEPADPPPRELAGAKGGTNGSIGGGLGEAARALEASAIELTSAREHMP